MILLSDFRRLMARPASPFPVCFLCREPVVEGEACIRLRSDTYVHRGCATYRQRDRRRERSRLGFPG